MKKTLFAALITCSAIPALAAPTGLYAGIDAGHSHTSNRGIVETKSNDTVFGAMAGYQINEYWGAELFYTQIGEYAGTNKTGNLHGHGDPDAYGLVAVGMIPLADGFSFFGKLGYARTKTHSTGNDAFGSIDIGATRNAPTYGAGIRYDLTPSFGLRFGLDHFGEAHHGYNLVAPGKNVLGPERNFSTNVYSLTALLQF